MIIKQTIFQVVVFVLIIITMVLVSRYLTKINTNVLSEDKIIGYLITKDFCSEQVYDLIPEYKTNNSDFCQLDIRIATFKPGQNFSDICSQIPAVSSSCFFQDEVLSYDNYQVKLSIIGSYFKTQVCKNVREDNENQYCAVKPIFIPSKIIKL